jgi:hypothetical protein
MQSPKEEFNYIADQIENHSRAIGYLMAELREKFPPGPLNEWRLNPETHRPEEQLYFE